LTLETLRNPASRAAEYMLRNNDNVASQTKLSTFLVHYTTGGTALLDFVDSSEPTDFPDGVGPQQKTTSLFISVAEGAPADDPNSEGTRVAVYVEGQAAVANPASMRAHRAAAATYCGVLFSAGNEGQGAQWELAPGPGIQPLLEDARNCPLVQLPNSSTLYAQEC
jgi:hypothetical protein